MLLPVPEWETPLSNWGAQVHVKKLWKVVVVWIGNCDVTSIEIRCN